MHPTSAGAGMLILSQTGIRVAVVGKGVAELNGGRSRSVYVRQGQIRQRVVNVLFAADSRRLNVPKIRAPAGIQAFDVSPTNDLYVAGGNDGELVVGTLPGLAPAVEEAAIVGASDIEQRARHRMAQLAAEHEARQSLNLTGHLGDVRSARFFPSGEGMFWAPIVAGLTCSSNSHDEFRYVGPDLLGT